MQFDPKLTLDGLMTLIGGTLALIGVWWSNQRDTSNLQRQLDAEKAMRREEQDRHTTAVAAALITEVNDFYQFGIRGLYDRMKRWFPQGSISGVTTFPEFGALPPATTIYQATAHEVGSLSQKSLRSVISLYNSVISFLDLYDVYRGAWRSSGGAGVDPILLQDIWDQLPQLILDSHGTCELLATEYGIPFINSQLQIAGLDGSAKQHLQENAMTVTTRLKHDLKESLYRLDGQ